MFRRSVPAFSAGIPASTSVESSAAACSTSTPTALAAGAALLIAALKVSMSKADRLALFAITSTIRPVSSAGSWKALSVCAAMVAALARSVPVAAARSSTAGVAARICCMLKPSLPSSVCNSVTCEAVNAVVAPYSLASAVRSVISALDTPMMAARLLCAASNSSMMRAPSPSNRVRP